MITLSKKDIYLLSENELKKLVAKYIERTSSCDLSAYKVKELLNIKIEYIDISLHKKKDNKAFLSFFITEDDKLASICEVNKGNQHFYKYNILIEKK